jgi:hypothetical protein
MRLGPAEIHAKNHFGPVLRLGSAGAGLNIDIRVTGVHLTREHALEFEGGETFLETAEVTHDLAHGVAIVFLFGQRQQFLRIDQPRRQFVNQQDNLLKCSALLPQRLRSIRLIPDIGLLKFALYLGQSLCLAFVVKDTPSTHACVQQDRLSSV